MKSPFPGMDPYIEQCGLWGDFHSRLILAIADAIGETAPQRYLVRTQERSYLVLVDSEDRAVYPIPDVNVTVPEARKKTEKKRGATAGVENVEDVPITMRAFIKEEHYEAFVEIYEDAPEQRLVTSIEVLSPSNKRSGTEGRDLYLRKRQSLLLSDVSLVEIDLLRGGQRMPMLDPWPNSPYTLMVARARKPQLCKVWPAHFQRPLPRIPVPLLKPDPDLQLGLQPLLDAIYQRSRYGRSIDYTRPLNPPLAAEESAWLQQQLRARQGQA